MVFTKPLFLPQDSSKLQKKKLVTLEQNELTDSNFNQVKLTSSEMRQINSVCLHKHLFRVIPDKSTRGEFNHENISKKSKLRDIQKNNWPKLQISSHENKELFQIKTD